MSICSVSLLEVDTDSEQYLHCWQRCISKNKLRHCTEGKTTTTDPIYPDQSMLSEITRMWTGIMLAELYTTLYKKTDIVIDCKEKYQIVDAIFERSKILSVISQIKFFFLAMTEAI